jgi:hypothetical protein
MFLPQGFSPREGRTEDSQGWLAFERVKGLLEGDPAKSNY